MQKMIVSFIFTVLIGCEIQSENPLGVRKKSKKTTDSFSLEGQHSYQEVKFMSMDSLLVNSCLTRALEFVDLYPSLDTITADRYENLILVDLLKENGFEVSEWGQGNWMKGPRIVHFTLSNQKCECQVDKLYYSTEQEGEYRVTERIKCEKR